MLALEEPLLTAGEVARLLSVSRGTVYRWADEGTMPSVRLGATVVRFDRGAVLEWLEGHSASIEGGGAGR